MAPAKKNDDTQDADKLSFEDAMGRLELVVRDLEEGDVELTAALGRYEEGVKLLRHCHDVLEKAQRKIELVTGVDSDGNPVTVPLDDSERSLTEKPKGRAGRPGMRPDTPALGEDYYAEGTGMDGSEGLF